MEWLWHWLLHDAYWYCFAFFLWSVSIEELLAPHLRWRNRDDQIAYGQREDSPANILAGRSRAPTLNRKPPAAKRRLTIQLR